MPEGPPPAGYRIVLVAAVAGMVLAVAGIAVGCGATPSATPGSPTPSASADGEATP